MISSSKALQVVLAIGTVSAMLLVGGCSSQPQLTKEELKLKKLYGSEVAEDQEYIVHSAGFGVRPVHEPFVTTFLRRIGEDGIEFFTEEHMMDRDPRYYAGKLSAFFHHVNMFGAPDTALASLKTLVEHTFPAQGIRVLSDSSFSRGDYSVREFHWEIVGGGTSPVGQYHIDQGGSHSAEMRGAIVVTDDATYFVYLTENQLATRRLRSFVCGDREQVSAREASALMGDRFHRFLQGIRFSIDS
jgi:hypothetical protein